MNKSGSPSSPKLDRRIIEKNRRIRMKDLCFKLASLIPSHYCSSSKGTCPLIDQLDHATTFIKQFQERVEELKERKNLIMGVAGISNNEVKDNTTTSLFKIPVIEVRDLAGGSSVVVYLTTDEVNKNLKFREAINILEEEGAEVEHANLSTVGNKVFLTFHAQAKISRIGVDTSRVSERLKELIYKTSQDLSVVLNRSISSVG